MPRARRRCSPATESAAAGVKGRVTPAPRQCAPPAIPMRRSARGRLRSPVPPFAEPLHGGRSRPALPRRQRGLRGDPEHDDRCAASGAGCSMRSRATPTATGHSESDAVRRSMLRVFETGRPDMLALVPYTIERETPEGRHVEERYWSATHTPVFDARGQVHAVLQHTTDVTDVQRTRAELEAVRQAQGATPRTTVAGRRVARTRGAGCEQRAGGAAPPTDVVVRAGAGLHGGHLRGPEYMFEIANPRTRNSSGAATSSAAGCATCCPRSSNRTTCNCSTRCAKRGGASSGAAWKSELASSGGELQPRYVDFVFQPIVDDDGAGRRDLRAGHGRHRPRGRARRLARKRTTLPHHRRR